MLKRSSKNQLKLICKYFMWWRSVNSTISTTIDGHTTNKDEKQTIFFKQKQQIWKIISITNIICHHKIQKKAIQKIFFFLKKIENSIFLYVPKTASSTYRCFCVALWWNDPKLSAFELPQKLFQSEWLRWYIKSGW